MINRPAPVFMYRPGAAGLPLSDGAVLMRLYSSFASQDGSGCPACVIRVRSVLAPGHHDRRGNSLETPGHSRARLVRGNRLVSSRAAAIWNIALGCNILHVVARILKVREMPAELG